MLSVRESSYQSLKAPFELSCSALSSGKAILLLSPTFRLLWECLWCSASQEEELRGDTGGRTDPALLRETHQRPGEESQQPATWTGKTVPLSVWVLNLHLDR